MYKLFVVVLAALLLAACGPVTTQTPPPAATSVPTTAPTTIPSVPPTVVPPTPVPPTAPAGPKIARDQIIRYDVDPLSLTITGTVISGERDRYTLDLLPGETMQVQVSALENNAVFTLLGPGGTPVPGTEEGQDVTAWQVAAEEITTYSILVGPTRGSAAYTLGVTVFPAGGYQPVSLEVCQTLQADVTQALGVRFTLIDAPFTDPIGGETGLACTLEANGTGADFGSVPDTVSKLRAALIGWTEDTRFAADGPTGSVVAFTRDSGLLIVTVGWEPDPEANCSPTEPISACPLTPEQQWYIVRLQAAQK